MVWINSSHVDRFHSINIPSEWGPCKIEKGQLGKAVSFHSINIPSEWGQQNLMIPGTNKLVSIQLISPASGDVTNTRDLPSSW